MENSDIALILLGIAGICVVGAKHFIDEERKELRNRNCVCPKRRN